MKNNFENEKVIFIGDSYLQGYTPSGTVKSWGTYLIELIKPERSYVIAEGGAGFSHSSASTGHTIAEMWENQKGNVDFLNSATLVFVMGGYNDNDQEASTLSKRVDTFFMQLVSDCPNAKIIYMFNPSKTCGRKQTIRTIYSRIRARGNVIPLDSWKWMIFDSNFSSDNVHPTQTGQSLIARSIYKSLQNGKVENFNQLYISDVSGYTFNLEANDNMLNIYVSGKSKAQRATPIGHFPSWIAPFGDGITLRWSFATILGTTKNALVDLGSDNKRSVYLLQTDNYIEGNFKLTASVDLLEFLG